MPKIISGQTLYLNSDKTAIVPGNSPDAAWLLVAEGGEVDSELLAKYQAQPTEDEAAQVDADSDLESKSVPQLRELAEAQGVNIAGITRKADLIEALESQNARTEAADTGGEPNGAA